MATARTKSDALGYYASSPAGLGGIRADFELYPLDAIVSTPIGPIVVQSISPANGTGTGVIRAASTTTLAYTAPGDTEGTPVTVSANSAALLESGTASKSVRVYRDSVYNPAVLGGSMSLNIIRRYNDIVAGPNATEAGGDYYGCLYLRNHSDAAITSVTVTPAVLGTQRTSDGTQLSGGGAGTITTTGSLADWPTSGWCHIRTNAPATREIVYYTSRTSTSLTVPAAGRGLLGTSAAAGASTDTITPVAGIRLWLETPSGGAVQEIANHTTEPTGAAWATSATVASLAAGDERGLWIHRDIPTDATVELEQLTGLDITYTYSATAYTHAVRSYYRIGDTGLEQYELYVGDGTAPNFSGAPTTTSTTLGFTSALAADSTYYYATRYRNRYNLTSFNVLTERRVIDAGGVDITDSLTNPSDITLTSKPGGEADLTLTYRGSMDATMADYWRLYITTDGTNPDPGTDTPVDYLMSAGGFALNDITQTITLGPYDYDTDLRIIARVYSSELADESSSTTVTTLTVNTQDPVQAGWLSLSSGALFGYDQPAYSREVAFGAATVEIRNGETIITGSAEVIRGVLGNNREARTTFDFYNVAHSAAGTASPIEAVSSSEIYINVAGTRRAKLDITNARIEAASFVFTNTPISLPVIGPTHTTATLTYIMVLNGQTGRWEPIIKLDSSGIMTITAAILQE